MCLLDFLPEVLAPRSRKMTHWVAGLCTFRSARKNAPYIALLLRQTLVILIRPDNTSLACCNPNKLACALALVLHNGVSCRETASGCKLGDQDSPWNVRILNDTNCTASFIQL